MSVKEHIIQVLEGLNDVELQQVADYLAFLKLRSRICTTPSFDAEHIAALYAEFTDEDYNLAEEGMEAYSEGLLTEDTR